MTSQTNDLNNVDVQSWQDWLGANESSWQPVDNHADVWASWLSGLKYEDLPGNVPARMKRSLLDSIGCAIYGGTDESAHLIHQYIKGKGGSPESTIIGTDIKTTSFNAALAHGTAIHATELAESFTRGVMHVGNVVPPAALAEAERVGASGKDLITALAAGFELAIRAGLSGRIDNPSDPTLTAKDETRPASPMKRVSPVTTFGIYGATAAASKLLNLDEAHTKNALTLGTALTSMLGSRTAVFEGASSKDVDQGMTNAMGVMAAELAELGITGPSDIVQHIRSVVTDAETQLLTKGLGDFWFTRSGGVHFKIHACAGMVQSAFLAALDATKGKTIDTDSIESIEVLANHRAVRLMSMPDIDNPVAARTNIPYGISAMLTFADEVRDDPHFIQLYTPEKVADPRRFELAKRISVVGDDELERIFDNAWPMQMKAIATFRFKDGSTLVGEGEVFKETAFMTFDEVAVKFRNVAGKYLPKDKVETIVDTVAHLDEQKDLSALISLLKK